MRRQAYDARMAAQKIDQDDPLPIPDLSIKITSDPRFVPPRILVMVIGSLIVLGILLQIAFSVLNHKRGMMVENDVSMAEKRAAVKDYEQYSGASSPEEIAASRIREEEVRAQDEERFQARSQEEARRKQERELEESRRYAAQVSRNLQASEEHAQREAEREKMRVEQEERFKREEQQQRQEEQQRLWLRQLKQ